MRVIGRGRVAVVLAVAVWAAAVSSSVPRAQAQPETPPAAAGLERTITQYCAGCHNARTRTAATASGVVLDHVDFARVAENGDMWEKVVRKLRAGAMPPAGMPRPDAAAHDALVSFLETTLDREAAHRPNPGRPSPHRLNRAEYANAIRDLLALHVDPSALLPADDSADGFDNNADVLSVSPVLLERYLSAAATISALAVGDQKIVAGSETYRIRGDASQTTQNEGLPPGTRGGLMAMHTFPLDGEYVIKVKLLEINLGSIRGLEYENQLEVTVDGERVLLAPVGGAEDYTQSSLNATNVVNSLAERLQVRVKVKAGQRGVGAAFLMKNSAQGANRLQAFQRSTLIATDHLGLPHVENITITGPFNATGVSDTPSRSRLFVCRPTRAADETAPASATASARSRRSPREVKADEDGCAKTIISTLARRAYRRPVTDTDVTSLMSFYDAGRREGFFDRGIELATRAVLVSPKFIFRVERDPAGVAPGSPYRISDVDLASRLSFFLWSSIPDEELLDLATRGQLSKPAVLDAQVRRMLADPRSQSLTDNFAGQWLHIRNLRNTTPDKNDFPDFDDNLRQAFERELELFVGSVINEDRSVLELLTADYTFLNERLAKHYRIRSVYGPDFRRVVLTQDGRRGRLGKGGALTLTSHADRTSPVVRGKWILDNLLGTPPPPAPAVVPPFPEEVPGVPTTVRARMEQHRSNPACAGCHKVMDPLGLALENFDAVGAWRTRESGIPIDASGELTDGTKIDGVAALRDALVKRPDVLVGTMAEKLMTYALGRTLEHQDMPAVRAIVRSSSRDSYRFSSLVRGIVSSAPFQMRSARGPS